MQAFDLVVIGCGTAGSIAASACRSAGWTVDAAQLKQLLFANPTHASDLQYML